MNDMAEFNGIASLRLTPYGSLAGFDHTGLKICEIQKLGPDEANVTARPGYELDREQINRILDLWDLLVSSLSVTKNDILWRSLS